MRKSAATRRACERGNVEKWESERQSQRAERGADPAPLAATPWRGEPIRNQALCINVGCTSNWGLLGMEDPRRGAASGTQMLVPKGVAPFRKKLGIIGFFPKGARVFGVSWGLGTHRIYLKTPSWLRPATKPPGVVAPPPQCSPLHCVVVAPCPSASRSPSGQQSGP